MTTAPLAKKPKLDSPPELGIHATASTECFLFKLPGDVLKHIFTNYVFTTSESLLSRATCKIFNQVITDSTLPDLWKKLTRLPLPGPIDFPGIMRVIPEKPALEQFRELNKKIKEAHPSTPAPSFVRVAYSQFDEMQQLEIKKIIELHFKQANALVKQQHFSEAFAELQKGCVYLPALKDDTLKAGFHNCLAYVYMKQGNIEGALAEWSKGLACTQCAHWLRASIHVNLGDCLLSQDQHNQAIHEYQKGIDTLSDQNELLPQKTKSELHYKLGNLFKLQNETVLADHEFHKAASLKLNLSKQQLERGILQEAISECQRGITIETRVVTHFPARNLELKAQLYLQAGQLSQRAHNPQAAIQYYQLGVDAEGNHALKTALRTHLGSAFASQGDYHQALAQYQLGLSCAEADAKAKLLGRIGLTHAQLGQFQDALTYLEKGLAVQHENKVVIVALHRGLGAVLESQGKTKEAIDHFKKGLAIEHSENAIKVDTCRRLGKIYLSQRNYKEAIAYLQRALNTPHERSAITAELHLLLGQAYASEKNQQQAIVHLKEGLTIPHEKHTLIAELRLHLGQILASQGNYQKAYHAFEKGYSAIHHLDHAMKADLHLGLGQALEMQGRYAEAYAEFRAGLAIKNIKNETKAEIHLCLGKMYASQNKTLEAISEVQKGLAISCENSALVADLHTFLDQLYPPSSNHK